MAFRAHLRLTRFMGTCHPAHSRLGLPSTLEHDDEERTKTCREGSYRQHLPRADHGDAAGKGMPWRRDDGRGVFLRTGIQPYGLTALLQVGV
jgi:hypothetical protein